MNDRPGIALPEWYRLVRGVVETPETYWIETPQLFSDDPGERFAAAALDLLAVADGKIIFPAFLRTGYTSGKHDWIRTCFVPNVHVLPSHMRAICEYSELADLVGLPTTTWVLREYLPVAAAFTAFEDMPITKERRYFVVDGRVVGHHPYWPPGAFNIEDLGWRIPLERINKEPASEVAFLTSETEKVGSVVPGAWSVDWLWAGRWWLIDMAWAEASFVWWDHPNAPEPDAWQT
jgi:hypothetical protein